MKTSGTLHNYLIVITPPQANYKYSSVSCRKTYTFSKTARNARLIHNAANSRRFFMQYEKYADDS